MNPDREPSRLPLRAGAMLLLAVAIVFIGLGWHSAATSGDDPEKDLQAAQPTQTQVTTTTMSGASASAGSSATKSKLCVFNAGSVSGLAGEVSDELKAKGYEMDEPGNLSTSSITENTIFYDEGQKSEAEDVAQSLGGNPSVESRPSSFTDCSDGIPVIVVTQ
ncbi:LytR C-terminal domain-containing protein [Gordonia sp. CPCC 206044]|uniref:LytR C-terminal domain-containing protein n=1 Tax=Gordonia sp. CPCC 206044 TaxID=3140793 RepID=UPI003AF3E21F